VLVERQFWSQLLSPMARLIIEIHLFGCHLQLPDWTRRVVFYPIKRSKQHGDVTICLGLHCHRFMLKYVEVYAGIGDLRMSSHALCQVNKPYSGTTISMDQHPANHNISSSNTSRTCQRRQDCQFYRSRHWTFCLRQQSANLPSEHLGF
jgi:hypothetical protein